MSKTQRDALDSEGSGECFRPNPDRLHIAEDDPSHANHHAHMLRVREDDPDNVAMYESLLLNGWARGSVLAIYSDGTRYVIAEGRRRLTALRRVNEELKRQKKKPIRPYAVITDDPGKTEAALNSGRKDDPPLVKARRFVEMKAELGAHAAAALLHIRLDYANALAQCLTLPADLRAKVNSGELPPDVAMRAAKKGGAGAVVDIVGAATDPASGKVDPAKVKAAAKEMPKRPKAIRRDVGLAMVDRIERAGVNGAAWTDVNVVAVIRYILGDREQTNGRKWLCDLVRDAEQAAKNGGAKDAAE